eukprot:TRINITY_DN3674_c0_g2_i2.p1 TRINITY_DN3674_c0_g2~~TRINITY_DN3674_c0_g2_i2.p1  ORF type:complete len:372 (-),score=80.23 TRINITY_DN3674_c0_g2_i2:212-1327(-)
MDFVGPPIDDDLAPKIAYGYVDPYTYEPFETPKPQIQLTGLRTSGNASNTLKNSFNQSLNKSTININTSTTNTNSTTTNTTTTTRLSSGSRLSSSGPGPRKRKPIELDVQKNKISEYFNTPSKISGSVSKPFVPPRSSSQDSSYSYSYSSSSSQSQSSQSQSSQSPSSTKKRKREELEEEEEVDQTDDCLEVLVARTPPKKIFKNSSGPVQVVVKSRFFSPSSSSTPTHLPGSPLLNRSSSSSSLTRSTICEEKKIQKLKREDSFSDVICISSSTSTSTSSSFDCNSSFSNTTPNTSTNNHSESPAVIDLTVDIPADMSFSSPLVTPTRLTRIKTAMKKTPSTSSLHAYFAKKGFTSSAKNVITSPYWHHS